MEVRLAPSDVRSDHVSREGAQKLARRKGGLYECYDYSA
jgi:hypothetical protein